MEILYDDVLDYLTTTTKKINLLKEQQKQYIKEYEYNQQNIQTQIRAVNHDLHVMSKRKSMLHSYFDELLTQEDIGKNTIVISKADWDEEFANPN